MARNKHQRKQTDASKFLEESSQDGEESQDVSESESPANQANEAASEPSVEASNEPKQPKPAVKIEEKASEIPGKFRKFQ